MSRLFSCLGPPFLGLPFFCKAKTLSTSLSRSIAFSLRLAAAAASSCLLSSIIRFNSAAVGSLSAGGFPFGGLGADISYKCASYLLAD